MVLKKERERNHNRFWANVF